MCSINRTEGFAASGASKIIVRKMFASINTVFHDAMIFVSNGLQRHIKNNLVDLLRVVQFYSPP